MKFPYWLILFVSALLLTACANQECEEVRPAPNLNIVFRKYTTATRNPQQTKDTSIVLSRVYAESLKDSLYPVGSAAARTVAVRLSPLADSTTFVLESAGTGAAPLTRTFTVRYNRQPSFISQACGYEWSFSNLSVSGYSSNLDTVVVINPTINPIRNEIHIQLYLQP